MGLALAAPVAAGVVARPLPVDAEAAGRRAAALLRAEGVTAADLAELAVPGLPETGRSIRRMMERRGVFTSRRVGQGGATSFYRWSAMPRDLREAIHGHLQALAVAAANTAGAVLDDQALTRSQQQLAAATPRRAARAECRAEAVRAFDAFVKVVGYQGRRAAGLFAARWARGEVEAPDWARAGLPAISATSLLRWQARLGREGAIALAGDYRARVALIDVDPELRRAAEGFIASHPHGTGAQLIATLRATFRTRGCSDSRALPSYRAACRWLAYWRAANRQLHAHLLSPDAHRSRFRPSFGTASAGVVRPNQLWELDSTPGDVMLQEEGPDGRPVRSRHAVLGVVDVATRRMLLQVAPSSTGAGVALLLRRAILAWGVPEAIRTDNGADYVSRQVTRVLADLGVARELTPPFTPEAKPFIERALGAFSHGLVELLPHFSGHSVADAQAIRDRTAFAQRLMKRGGEAAELPLSPAEFQGFCDRWCADLHANRPHAGLGGDTPALRAAAHRAPLRRIGDERALDALLAPVAGLRTVTKKGIRIEGGTFIAAALGSRVGEQVELRHDPADLGRVMVFAAETGEFLCVAEDPERTGLDRREVAQAAKRVARREVQAGRARLREAAKAVPKGRKLVEAILDVSADAAANVVAFPRPSETHATPALEQLGRAARAGEAVPAAERSAEDAARAAWLAQKTARQAREAVADDAGAQRRARIARGLAVFDALAAGQHVPAEEIAWFGGYRTLGEFRHALRTARGLDPDTALSTA